MFAQSLLETSWAQRSRRGWMTLSSFGIQALIIGLLLTIPMLTSIGVPIARTVSTPITLGRHEPEPTPMLERAHNSGVQIIPYTGSIMEPGRIPTIIVTQDNTQTSGPQIVDRLPQGLGPALGQLTGLPLPLSGTRPIMPVISAAPPVRTYRTSRMLQGSLIRRVEPVYPSMARMARVQGPVVLEAIISKEGTMQNLRLISGHPMLVPAAIAAVSQWRYKPYILNGDAIEVETQITVNFVLGN